MSCDTRLRRKLAQLQLLSEFLWPMFVLVLHSHLPPLPTLQVAALIPFSQTISVLVFPCHVLLLPSLQACNAKHGLSIINRTNPLQKSCAVCQHLQFPMPQRLRIEIVPKHLPNGLDCTANMRFGFLDV